MCRSRVVKGFLVLIVLTVGVLTNAVTEFARYLTDKPDVQVSFVNQSSQDIKFLRLSNEGAVYLFENLKRGDSRPFELMAFGETSYSLDVEFENGARLKGGAGYVESGYKTKEIITDTEITSDVNLTPLREIFYSLLVMFLRYFLPIFIVVLLCYFIFRIKI